MDMVSYLPQEFRKNIDGEIIRKAEEIRMRAGQPLELVIAHNRVQRYGNVSAVQIRESLNYLTGYSPYAVEEEMRQGFFTIEGGHRVGISGHTSYHKDIGNTVTDCVSNISAINIRIAHEIIGCAKEIIPWMKRGHGWYHTFIFSPPGVGKTTCLRDCIRTISYGNGLERGYKVGVVDERSEIAACHLGIAQNDLGPRTDVLDNCPKSVGMIMLLRSMSPEFIAVDELGGKEDWEAVETAMNSGVYVLGTVHAKSIQELLTRQPRCREWAKEDKIRFVGLSIEQTKRRISVYDRGGKKLWES